MYSHYPIGKTRIDHIYNQCKGQLPLQNLEMVNVDPLDIGTTRRSKDQGADATGFGHHLLELGNRHRMVIYNGLAKWPGSEELTCFPHGGGESTVDYLIGRPEATHMINSFRVAPCPIGADHSFLYCERVPSSLANSNLQSCPCGGFSTTVDYEYSGTHT